MSGRILLHRCLATLGLGLALCSSACGGGGSGAAPVGTPTLDVLEPADHRLVRTAPAETVEIRFTDTDPTATGRIDVLADRDGLPDTTHDQIVLAHDLAPQNGLEQVVPWLVENTPPGEYAILVRVRFGTNLEILGTAAGRIRVNSIPILSVAGAAIATRVSRGGMLCYGYEVRDPDNVPSVQLTLDVDGDPATTIDAFVLPLPANAPGCTITNLPALPVDTYHLMGTASDGFNDPVHVIANGTIEVADVSWATSFGGTESDGPSDLIVYDDGSSLVLGTFSGTITLGGGEANETPLTTTGSTGIYLARFNPDGSLDWAKGLGGGGDDSAGRLARSVDGGFVVTGTFEDQITLGTGEQTETALDATNGGVDRFVARFNASGGLVWAKRGGDAKNDYASFVATFGDGSLVTTSVSGDPTAALADRVAGTLERYDASGTLAWSRTLTGTGHYNQFTHVETYANGDLLVAGLWDGQITLGSGEPGETTLTSTAAAGLRQAFVAKYDVNGTLAWARRLTSTSEIFVGGLATYGDGSFLASGTFTGVATWGPGETGQLQRPSAGASDGYVARYAADGTFQWARLIGAPVAPGGVPAGSGEDRLGDIEVLPDGSFVVVGSVFGPASVESTDGPYILEVTTQYAAALVVRYETDGTVRWLRTDKADPSQSELFPGLLAVAADGSCLAAGGFTNTVQFGANDDTPVSVTSINSMFDVYLTRFNADGKY